MLANEIRRLFTAVGSGAPFLESITRYGGQKYTATRRHYINTSTTHFNHKIITIRYLHGLRYAIQFIVRAFFSLTEQPMRRDVIFNLKLTPTCQCSPHRSINETIEWNHNTIISRYRIIHGDGVLSLKIDCGWDQTMTRTRRRQFWFVTKFRASYSIRSSFSSTPITANSFLSAPCSIRWFWRWRSEILVVHFWQKLEDSAQSSYTLNRSVKRVEFWLY